MSSQYVLKIFAPAKRSVIQASSCHQSERQVKQKRMPKFNQTAIFKGMANVQLERRLQVASVI